MNLTTLTKWDDRLAFEIALMLEGSGEPLTEILKARGLAKEEMTSISVDPVFNNKVNTYRDDIRANGLTFRLKARAQAEELLTTSYNLIHDIDVSPAVKADLIKSTVKWAGLEPRDKGPQVGGGGVSIQINLGGSTPEILDVTPSYAGLIEAEEAEDGP